MVFGSVRKNWWNSAVQSNKVISKKKTGVMRQGRKKVEVGTLFLFNDKTNVVADKVLSYFECLSSKFEVLAHISGLL